MGSKSTANELRLNIKRIWSTSRIFAFIFSLKVHGWDSMVLSETGSYKQSTVLNNNIDAFGQTLSFENGKQR